MKNSRKRNYCCVENNSGVFCDVGDTGDYFFWKDKTIN